MDRSITDVLLMQYESFTASEKKSVDYVLSHQRESQHMSITELSAACSVAISTVSVFCRKLKLAGFNDFKLELARANMLAHPQAGSMEETEVLQGDSLETVLKTSQLLRYSLDNQNQYSSIRKELAAIRSYIAIQKLRFGERIRFLILNDHAEDCLDMAFPGMILQPLVENAVKHGLKNVTRDGEVEIYLGADAQRLTISPRTVENTPSA